jgi:hypothetical protein
MMGDLQKAAAAEAYRQQSLRHFDQAIARMESKGVRLVRRSSGRSDLSSFLTGNHRSDVTIMFRCWASTVTPAKLTFVPGIMQVD